MCADSNVENADEKSGNYILLDCILIHRMRERAKGGGDPLLILIDCIPACTCTMCHTCISGEEIM